MKEKTKGEIRYCLYKAIATLKGQARANYLNFAWWILEPLFLMAVFYLVFGLLLQKGGEGFELQLIVGIVAWLWFATSANQAMTSIIQAKGLIQTMPISKWVFPNVSILIVLIKNIVVYCLLIFLLVIAASPAQSWLYLPFILITQLFLITAVGYSLAIIIPFIPDLKFIVTPGLQMLMFCSGVFYSVDRLPENLREYFLYNPIANLIEQYRVVLLDNAEPDIHSLLIILIFSLLWTAGSLLLMKKYDHVFPRVVG